MSSVPVVSVTRALSGDLLQVGAEQFGRVKKTGQRQRRQKQS
ncbi:MAG TPA: hypothetical protein VLC97_14330 [Rhodanobacteraceae bacterium]|nr:hypothetical protein [Rhodanobacteraceae bacterium]